MELTVQITDEDLLSRLRNGEDNFVERKTVADQGDALKTVVAFANSAPYGLPCVLFIGVKDDGTFEARDIDFDDLQKKIHRMLQRTYPRVPYIAKIVADGSHRALAVIVPGSPLRPHFAGPSYIRVGSQTEEASRSQFENLIAQRNAKVYRLSQHVGAKVEAEARFIHPNNTSSGGSWGIVQLIECNESWITLEGSTIGIQSFPLNDVELSFDPKTKRLMLRVKKFIN